MRTARPTVSLVIPAYNEESHLGACLEAVAAQTVRPLEVIVVDNNSTDDTANIARRYPFVTLLREPRQGVVYARDAGFNAARGDIIGRTDADSILAPNWVEELQKAFVDPAVEATSGVVEYRDVGCKKAFDVIDKRFRFFLAGRTAARHELFLYGVTMGVRRSAWHAVRGDVCHERHMHEDLDLAAHMSRRRQRVTFTPNMHASIAPRQAASGLKEYNKYVWSGPRVYAEHGLRSQCFMYPMAVFTSVLYLPIHLLYKGYNPTTRRFSLRYALRATSAPTRVSPVSDVI
ncbi:MAG TPA: glycosyltransferase family 2 protein [Candidatus Saccharimonadales bacterium]|nr:glycosyltransferase family 2 protein [Candidatus Saccharimonadales bacterium]